MKIAILGSGGVGGYYGGLLARSGHDVTFLARGAHLAAIRDHGLRVESVHGDFVVRPAKATDDPARAGPVDLVIVAVKSYDLEAVAGAAGPLVGPSTLFLPLLNGLDAADRLAVHVGGEHVLAGLTHLSSSLAAPGVIRQVSPVRRITFGLPSLAEGLPSLAEGLPPHAEEVRAALAGAGIEALWTADVNAALWEKFLFIASISGVCCLARRPMGVVLHTPETRALYLEALEEAAALAQACAVALQPGAVERNLRLAESFPPNTRPSLLVALEAGQRLELEALSGTVVRSARHWGVAAPVHRIVYAALKPSCDP